MRPKNILKIIILSTFIFNMFFVFAVSQSLAINMPVKLFEFPNYTKTGYIDISESPTVNVGINNKAKVCRNVECDNPEIINFEISENDPLVIDTVNGLSGKVWGGELGWVVFNPPYGGVFFADAKTGLLKGTAWSETSGVINFSVTGQKVIIDPKTGEWNGWAWASGPYGGWVKFDCSEVDSCVRTTWRSGEENQNSPVLTVKEKENKPSSPTFIIQTKEIFINVLNGFYNSFENLYDGIKELVSIISDQSSYSFANLYDGTKQLSCDTFSSLSLSFVNLNTSLSSEVAKINNSAFTSSYKEISKINGNAFTTSVSNIKEISNNLMNGTVAFGDTTIDLFEKTSQLTYNTFSYFSYTNDGIVAFGDTTIDLFSKTGKLTYNTLSHTNNGIIAFGDITIDLFSKTGKLVSDSFRSYDASIAYLNTSIMEEIGKINGNAFTTSANNIKQFTYNMTDAKDKALNITGDAVYDTYVSLSSVGTNIKTNLKASVLDAFESFNNLIK